MMEHMILSSPNGNVDVRVEPEAGGRISSIRVGRYELLVDPATDPVTWGCFPMVPFPGRIRRGMLDFEGQQFELPRNFGPHAMHGYGFTTAWTQIDETTITFSFGPPWPFAGVATQTFSVEDHRITMTMSVEAQSRQPVSFGWHPWFRREIGAATPAQLVFDPASMYQRDAEGIPTGELVTPPEGPWDDCFTDVRRGPIIRWGSFELSLSSSTDHWTVYNEPAHALCVEPQTGPPNESNTSPRVLDVGETMSADFTLEWR